MTYGVSPHQLHDHCHTEHRAERIQQEEPNSVVLELQTKAMCGAADRERKEAVHDAQ